MEYQGCNKCKYEKTDRYSYPCSFCVHNAEEHFQPKTNADRIRNMTDEELAEFFTSPCADRVGEEICDTEPNCRGCFLKWLQAEVKEV